ncbi:MAG TPA: hypothetical protein V6D14_21130 [Coleofasciculaceae cyanobacterium]|jgi:hypothetical protein
MKTQERVQVLTPHSEPNRSLLILLVVLGSFTVGLIPIAYSSASVKGQSQTAPITGEAGLWSAFGEKVDTSTGGLKQ